jgi:hypothetical protein
LAEEFQARFADALQRRLYPNANLYVKQLGAGIGRDAVTVGRWSQGQANISARDLHRIARFFARRGDLGFIAEIFGDVIRATDNGDPVDRLRTILQDYLLKLGPDRSDAKGRDFWITALGKRATCQNGHAEYIQRMHALPPDVGDLVEHAISLLGWIAIRIQADGVVIVRHDGKHVAPLAAERTCEWLENEFDRVQTIRRFIRIEGQWVEAVHITASSAINAISVVARLSTIARRPWTIEPRSIDEITDKRLGTILRLYHQTPGKFIHLAGEMGAMTTSSVLAVDGDNVTSLHIASGFGWDADTRMVEGLNVLARPDTSYALMVRDRILRTKREGISYSELTGTINANNVRYLSLALPEPGPNGRVMTSSIMLENEPID